MIISNRLNSWLNDSYKGDWIPTNYTIKIHMMNVEKQRKRRKNHLWTCSAAWLLAVDDEPVLPFSSPLSAGGDTPHLPSDSVGSITLTDPSVNPTANWFASWGCAATTTGDTAWLLRTSKINMVSTQGFQECRKRERDLSATYEM